MFNNIMNKKLLLALIVIVLLSLIGLGGFWYYKNQTYLSDRANQEKSDIDVTRIRDIRRVDIIRNMQLALEEYYSEHNAYPTFPNGVDRSLDLRNQLLLALEKYSFKTNAGDENLGVFYYRISNDSKSYILGVLLEERDSRLLTRDFNDFDGIIYGLDCDDPIYCATIYLL